VMATGDDDSRAHFFRRHGTRSAKAGNDDTLRRCHFTERL
jgi:hypothetical protein